MTLPEEARERLADVQELEPTTNGELRNRWGMGSGKEVHRYLTTELADYTYRDDSNKIRARPDPDSGDTPDSDGVGCEPGADTGTQSPMDERDHSIPSDEESSENASTAGTTDVNDPDDVNPPSSDPSVYSVGEVADIVETAVGEARHEAAEHATPGGQVASVGENTDRDASSEGTATEPDYEGVVCRECWDGTLIDVRGHNQIELPDGRVVGAPHDYYCNNFATCGTGFTDE